MYILNFVKVVYCLPILRGKSFVSLSRVFNDSFARSFSNLIRISINTVCGKCLPRK